MINISAIFLFLSITLLIFIVALLLTQRGERKACALLFFIGIIVGALKISVVQMTPQYQDVNPDATVYHLNGLAFMHHWNGFTADAKKYMLMGMIQRGVDWRPNDNLPYSSVIGSRNYLYNMYVGMWYFLVGENPVAVILSHICFLAFLAPSAFSIVQLLGWSRKVAWIAAGLTLIDPSSAVNAAWLLKDTIVSMLALLICWAMLIFLQKDRKKISIFLLILALSGLSIIRFHLFLVFFVAMLFPLIVLLRQKEIGIAIYLVFAVLAAFWISHQLFTHIPLSSSPVILATQPPTTQSLITSMQQTIQGSIDTISAHEGDAGYDETTAKWIQRFRENPVLALIKTVARTLFAPYPWVAIYPGLTYTSFSELYYPGNLLWMVFMPAFFIGLVRIGWTKTPSRLFLAAWLFFIVLIYVIFQGEFSTRQRVFLMPLLWIIVAIGINQIIQRWKLGKV